jgi:hypothetical protein
MTMTVSDRYDEGGPGNGSSLAADPWSTDWNLPNDVELKAVGWPGARPIHADSSEVPTAVRDPLPTDPHPAIASDTAEPMAEMSASGHLPPPPAPSF